MLTHYTKKPENLVSILTNGFAWMPNRRDLMHILVPEHIFSSREPQQFGMICFTDMLPDSSDLHLSSFGKFGIVVTEEWASRNKAQKVLYVENDGPFVDALKEIFQIGYLDCKARIEHKDDSGWNMAYENKAAASSIVGAQLWASLLGLYEYMESSTHSNESEWRITNPLPHYGLAGKRPEDLTKAASNPKGWNNITNFLKVLPEDISTLVCPGDKVEKLKSLLPVEYKNVPILQAKS